VAQPIATIARAAVRRLVDRMAEPGLQPCELLPCELLPPPQLVVRKSTAAQRVPASR